MARHEQKHSEWQTLEHALAYLTRADNLPHRTEGERVLIEQIPQNAKHILDLGTGNGRTLALARLKAPLSEGVALDFSEPMLEQATKRFANDQHIKITKHDFRVPLPAHKLGKFDAIVSSLAIHHLADERKKQLYHEIFHMLEHSGVFCNLEHVSSPTQNLHLKFLRQVGQTPETEDPSNKLLDAETQLKWLEQIGFTDVDCYWKWLEIALLVGVKP